MLYSQHNIKWVTNITLSQKQNTVNLWIIYHGKLCYKSYENDERERERENEPKLEL